MLCALLWPALYSDFAPRRTILSPTAWFRHLVLICSLICESSCHRNEEPIEMCEARVLSLASTEAGIRKAVMSFADFGVGGPAARL